MKRTFVGNAVLRDPAGKYHLVWTSSCVPWAKPAPLTGAEPAEGPAPLIKDCQLLLLFDQYAGGGLGAVRSRDLDALTDVAAWEDVSSSVFAASARHGSVVELPHEVFRAVAHRAAQ